MIKFRGIPAISIEKVKMTGANYDGTFVYGNFVAYGKRAFIIGDVADVDYDYFFPKWWVEVDPGTVGQSTGLEDMDGNIIYEGDILKTDNEVNYVDFQDCGFCTHDSEPLVNYAIDTASGLPKLIDEVFQVIGSIYKSPELLEADHD